MSFDYKSASYSVVTGTGARAGSYPFGQMKIVAEVEASEKESNIWDRDYVLRLFRFRTPDGVTGYGVWDETPSGYSSMTYDPDHMREVMFTDDFDLFARLVLDDHQRRLVELHDLKKKVSAGAH